MAPGSTYGMFGSRIFLPIWLWDALDFVWNKYTNERAQFGQILRITYCIDLFLVKLAILLQFLRVFVPLKNRDKMFWACHALIWLNLTYYTIYVFLAIFSCNPVKKGWSQRIPPIKGSCLDLRIAYTAGAAINAASDLSILILPQPIIWNLQLSFKKKIGLSAIFTIGLLWVGKKNKFLLLKPAHDDVSGCAASLVRLYYSAQLLHYQDFTYLHGVMDLWAVGETTSAILALCLPVSPKFFSAIQDSKFWSGLRRIPLYSSPQSKTQLVRALEPELASLSSSKANGERVTRDDH